MDPKPKEVDVDNSLEIIEEIIDVDNSPEIIHEIIEIVAKSFDSVIPSSTVKENKDIASDAEDHQMEPISSIMDPKTEYKVADNSPETIQEIRKVDVKSPDFVKPGSSVKENEDYAFDTGDHQMYQNIFHNSIKAASADESHLSSSLSHCLLINPLDSVLKDALKNIPETSNNEDPNSDHVQSPLTFPIFDPFIEVSEISISVNDSENDEINEKQYQSSATHQPLNDSSSIDIDDMVRDFLNTCLPPNTHECQPRICHKKRKSLHRSTKVKKLRSEYSNIQDKNCQRGSESESVSTKSVEKGDINEKLSQSSAGHPPLNSSPSPAHFARNLPNPSLFNTPKSVSEMNHKKKESSLNNPTKVNRLRTEYPNVQDKNHQRGPKSDSVPTKSVEKGDINGNASQSSAAHLPFNDLPPIAHFARKIPNPYYFNSPEFISEMNHKKKELSLNSSTKVNRPRTEYSNIQDKSHQRGSKSDSVPTKSVEKGDINGKSQSSATHLPLKDSPSIAHFARKIPNPSYFNSPEFISEMNHKKNELSLNSSTKVNRPRTEYSNIQDKSHQRDPKSDSVPTKSVEKGDINGKSQSSATHPPLKDSPSIAHFARKIPNPYYFNPPKFISEMNHKKKQSSLNTSTKVNRPRTEYSNIQDKSHERDPKSDSVPTKSVEKGDINRKSQSSATHPPLKDSPSIAHFARKIPNPYYFNPPEFISEMNHKKKESSLNCFTKVNSLRTEYSNIPDKNHQRGSKSDLVPTKSVDKSENCDIGAKQLQSSADHQPLNDSSLIDELFRDFLNNFPPDLLEGILNEEKKESVDMLHDHALLPRQSFHVARHQFWRMPLPNNEQSCRSDAIPLRPKPPSFKTSCTGSPTLSQKHFVLWHGSLALKNTSVNVQMHFVSGNPRIVNSSLPPVDGKPSTLKIWKRMKLSKVPWNSLCKKMKLLDEHCVLLVLPSGDVPKRVKNQAEKLKKGIMDYLSSRSFAGGIGNAFKTGFFIHVFNSCDFIEKKVNEIAPELLPRICDVPHLWVIISTV